MSPTTPVPSTTRPSFVGATAVSGVGYTPFTKRFDGSVLDLAVEACRAALADCGLVAGDVDGIVSYSLFNDSVPVQAVATSLALPELSFALDLNLGGQAPAFAALNAAMAVAGGMASNVLVYRALKGRSGVRIGSKSWTSATSQYRYPIGFTEYPQVMALWARRFMIETGATELDLAALVMATREHAVRNPRAIRRKPITMDEYMGAPMFVEPFRIPDCTTEVDGACAVLVTSVERARTLSTQPAVLAGGAWVTGGRSGLDLADPHLWPDYSRNCQAALSSRLWATSGLRPADMDVAEIYDCFSSVPLIGLEGLGLVERGGSGEFIRAGETALDGSLPMNTHGGLLCEGYLHGMNTLAEGVLQTQGRGDERQVAYVEHCLVTSGGLMDGSAVILAKDAA